MAIMAHNYDFRIVLVLVMLILVTTTKNNMRIEYLKQRAQYRSRSHVWQRMVAFWLQMQHHGSSSSSSPSLSSSFKRRICETAAAGFDLDRGAESLNTKE